jgi:hypothetical protein
MDLLKRQAISLAVVLALVANPSQPLVTPTVGASPLSRHEVEAAFLINFAKFVTWPQEAFISGTAPVTVGIVGEDQFGAAIDAAAKGQHANDRPIEVYRVARKDDLTRFHIVFIAASEEKHVAAILRRLENADVLVVSDIDRFCRSGGGIGFLFDGTRVRFEVNLGAAERGRMKVSTRLLALAAKVYQ